MALSISRLFSNPDIHPYDEIEWEKRDAKIIGADGEAVFKQEDVEFPITWSHQSSNIAVSKYFRGEPGTSQRETSIKQVINRVVSTITQWGLHGGYFHADDAEAFSDELTWLLINQYFAFNSPVWFNIGADGPQQASACFINEVDDSMESIMKLARDEAIIFKGGSGAGVNLSTLRGSTESLSGTGGKASGPVSFMKGYDAFAGVIKSGGRTRRAAKIIILNIDHPDIVDFIKCKTKEDQKARDLLAAGYSSGLDGDAYGTVAYQNANHSVRVGDDFMRAVADKSDWDLKRVTDGETSDTIHAADLFRSIAENAWETGDPGLQFDTLINMWNPVSNTHYFGASNPCAEYHYINNSACNLASHNLIRYKTEDGAFAVDRFRRASELIILAQEIMVANVDYPTEEIARNSKAHRPLGLGYANLGGLLMVLGLPYGSEDGRRVAAAITALMHASAASMSCQVADELGPFDLFEENRDPYLRVMEKHRTAAESLGLDLDGFTAPIYDMANTILADVCNSIAHGAGIRNGQLTLLAPTGCLATDTMLLSSAGILPLGVLGDVNGDKWQDLDLNIMQEKSVEKSSQFFINGEDHVMEITTKRGHALVGTYGHKIRIIDECGEYVWRKFQDIKPGDLAVFRLGGHEELLMDKPYTVLHGDSTPVHGNESSITFPDVLDERLAEVIGYYVGNGYTKDNYGLCLTVPNNNRDIDSVFESWAESIGVHIQSEERSGCHTVTIPSRRLVRWLKSNRLADKPRGNHGEGAFGASIPISILKSRTSVVCAFIRGLFDADGTVTLVKGTPSVAFSTVSPVLVNQVQVVLESLGIMTTRRQQPESGDRFGDKQRYEVRVANVRSARVYADKIGFISSRKKIRLTDGLSTSTGDESHGISIRNAVIQQDFYDASVGLPSEVRQDIAVRKTAAINLLWARDKISKYPQLRKTKIAAILSLGDVYFDVVVSNTQAGIQKTVDLSVPMNNTYVVSGFVSHNTIAFMMDADTTGIEPEFGLVKFKRLVGGGEMKMVNRLVPEALRTLGYDDDAVASIANYVTDNGTIENCPDLKDDHLPVFDCSIPPLNGERSIHYMDHVKMVAAVQPFLSGAVSKTINMPNTATVEDIEEVYWKGWEMGIKVMSIYRDGCKAIQPYASKSEGDDATPEYEVVIPLPRPVIGDAKAITHKFNVSGHEGYVSVSKYPDGLPSSLMVVISKEGSTLSGLLDAFAAAVTLGFQHGIPLQTFVDRFTGMRFEPHGFTPNQDIKEADSIIDYIFKWLYLTYNPPVEVPEMHTFQELPEEYLVGNGNGNGEFKNVSFAASRPAMPNVTMHNVSMEPIQSVPAMVSADAGPVCGGCGTIMVPNGACHRCPNCGTDTGCSGI